MARLAGLSWFLTIVTSSWAMIIARQLVAGGDAARTASNLLAHEMLFRSGTALLLVSTACYLAATVFVYELLKPVSRTTSLLAVAFSVVGCGIGVVGCLFDLVPLVLLKSGPWAAGTLTDQAPALAFVALKLREQTNSVGLVFFGAHCLLVGCLILRSIFLPRLVGGLMVLAGIGWLTFIWPPLAAHLAPYNLIPGAIGELTLTLWLLVKGVDVARWHMQAGGLPVRDATPEPRTA